LLRIDISPRAAADIRATVRYYAREASSATAVRFRDEFRAAALLLAERPAIGSHRFSHLTSEVELRVWSLDRFPFRLFYYADDEAVHILAVTHESRHISRALLRPVK